VPRSAHLAGALIAIWAHSAAANKINELGIIFHGAAAIINEMGVRAVCIL